MLYIDMQKLLLLCQFFVAFHQTYKLFGIPSGIRMIFKGKLTEALFYSLIVSIRLKAKLHQQVGVIEPLNGLAQAVFPV